MLRAPRAFGLCALVSFLPGTGHAQAVLGDRLARAVAAAPSDSFFPVLIEWEPPAPPSLGGLALSVSAVREPLERALEDRRARARDILEARGLRARYREGSALWVASAATAEATAEAIEALREVPGVRRIYLDEWIPVAGLQPPSAGGAAPSFVPWGVALVGGPELWQAGLTGKGRVVAFIDSGVDGSHPLLAARWRGRSRSVREAWFDPFNRSAEPADDIGHGTIVATVAVGALPAGDTLIAGDTLVAASGLDVVTGVAPEAEWIAANAFETFGGQTYTRRSVLLQAMQWVLDPDGDPATTDDVPDVVNNSWGEIPADEEEFCTGIYHRAIDALERAGIAMIFSAGNGRGGEEPVVPPANRADLLTNAFAVGAVEPSGDSVVVSSFSLGGPSPCGDGTSVKPEVVAPGRVPTFFPLGDGTIRAGAQAAGTSFSAPHASGAVALLRQAAPFVPPDDAKRALMETARDLDPPGPDQRSGAGLIDVVAAAQRVGVPLPALVRLLRWEQVADSGTFFTLQSAGDEPLSAGTVELRARAEGGRLDLGPAQPLPALAPRDTARVGPYPVPELPPGQSLPVELVVDAGGRSFRLPLVLHAKEGVAGSVVLTDGAASFGLDGAGRYGRVAASWGLSLGGLDPLAAAAFIVAAADRISDAAYVDVLSQPSNKTAPAATDTDWQLRSRQPEDSTAILSLYDDAQALRPVGVSVAERARLVSLGDTAAYALLESELVSAQRARLVVGLLADWDFDRDTVYWSPGLAALVARSAADTGLWAALGAVGPVTRAVAVPLGLRTTGGSYAPGSGVLAGVFEDADKAAWIGGAGDPDSDGARDDWAGLLTVGPLEVGAGVSARVGFVLAIASSEPGLAGALADARASAVPLALAGRRLAALPPFPNPFNPLRSPWIRFPFEAGPELRDGGTEAILEIFTVAGRPVHRDRITLDPGAVLRPFEWDGRGAGGLPVASGLYVYRIRVGARVARGKFLVLK